MLICNLKTISEQIKTDKRMSKAINFLLTEPLEKLATGTIPIDGDEVYARIMEYSTIPFEELKFEAHKKYIDIHFVISGKEAIWCLDIGKINVTDKYNPEKDVFHGIPKAAKDLSKIVLLKEDLAVFYPSDVHAPKGIVGSAETINKLVIKILY